MRLAAVIAFLAASALTTPSIAADQRSFVVQNQNDDLSIQRVWTAAAGTKAVWDESDLSSPIPAGNTMTFTFGPGTVCFIDVKVQFSDGFEQGFPNVNVCHNDRVLAK